MRMQLILHSLCFFRVNSQVFPLVSNQPFKVVSYSPEIVPCGSEFTANVLSNFSCPQRGDSTHTESVVQIFVPLAVFILVLLFIGMRYLQLRQDGRSFNFLSFFGVYNKQI